MNHEWLFVFLCTFFMFGIKGKVIFQDDSNEDFNVLEITRL
jgi:hypothetical protein